MYEVMRELCFRETPYQPGVGTDDSPQAKAVVPDAVADQEVTSKGQMQRIPIKTLTLHPMTRTKMRYKRESIVFLAALLLLLRHILSPIYAQPFGSSLHLKVFEFSFADLSLSPAHTQGLWMIGIVEESHYAFPRF
jgi:hypothetical protein